RRGRRSGTARRGSPGGAALVERGERGRGRVALGIERGQRGAPSRGRDRRRVPVVSGMPLDRWWFVSVPRTAVPRTTLGTVWIAGGSHPPILAHFVAGGSLALDLGPRRTGHSGTKRTSKTVGQYLPVTRNRSVPGSAAMPLATSAPARSARVSRPPRSATPVTSPVSGSIRSTSAPG